MLPHVDASLENRQFIMIKTVDSVYVSSCHIWDGGVFCSVVMVNGPGAIHHDRFVSR